MTSRLQGINTWRIVAKIASRGGVGERGGTEPHLGNCADIVSSVGRASKYRSKNSDDKLAPGI